MISLWDKVRAIDERKAHSVLQQRQVVREETNSLLFLDVNASLPAASAATRHDSREELARVEERQRWISSFRRQAEGESRLIMEGEARKQREIEEAKRASEEAEQARADAAAQTAKRKTEPSAVFPDPSGAAAKASPVSSNPLDEGLEQCLERLRQRESRADMVEKLDKTNKALKNVKLFLTMLTNTKRDLRLRLDGTPSELGPRPLLDYVEKKAPQQLEAAMQVIADRIVHCATANLAIDALLRGEANFALVYMTLLICLAKPAFVEVLKGSLEAACPFVQPGLKQHLENEAKSQNWSKEMRKKKLGYREVSEGDDEYLFRMQAIIGFYSALLQTSPTLLHQYSSAMPQAGVSVSSSTLINPLGGLAEAWRWLAKTLNSTKWRWTRFVVHAFLCVSGRDLSLVLPQQVQKVLILMQSEQFKRACEHSASHPNDDDRIRGFETFVNESLSTLKKLGALKGPGKMDEVDGRSVWIDPRDLPEGAIENYG